MSLSCQVCARSFEWSGRGPRPSVCGQRCRKRKQRMPAAVPSAMTEQPRWTRRAGKRPMSVSGRPASSTDAMTWAPYEAVAGSDHGVMLGGGLACWDLDGVIGEDGALHPDAAAVLRKVGTRALWVERSMSGRGLHVFVHGEEGPARVGERVSYYSWGRFIAVTGERYAPLR
ncbi:hypothetical protein [Nocardia sp. NPDC058480]|uniref:hypothetical protein n=1 Tax=Nocardia sp. NPDC058480 TaxID=3346522 RepID=UPI00365D8C0F